MNDWGIERQEIEDILSPLNERLAQLIGTQIGGRRRKFAYTLLLDAHRTSLAIRALMQARADGLSLMADAIEVLARRIVEMAIVASYLANGDVTVVDRFLKTSAAEWQRSLHREREGEIADAVYQFLPVKELPSYRQMAEEVDNELAITFSMFSYVSHPRIAYPYSMLEYNWDQHEFFWLRAGKAIGNLEGPITHLLEAYDAIDEATDYDDPSEELDCSEDGRDRRSQPMR